MEAAGLALGVAGIVIAFKGAIDTALLIEDFLEDTQGESRHWELRYLIQKTRLLVWGDRWKADDIDLCTLGAKSPEVRVAIKRILDEITNLNRLCNHLITKHEIGKDKIQSKFRWVIRAKADFAENVGNIKALVDELYGFSFESDQLRLLTSSFLPRMLALVGNPEILRSLSDDPPDGDPLIALSARTKLDILERRLEQPDRSKVPAPTLHDGNFKLVKGSSSIGLVTQPDGLKSAVWVEWTTFDSGPEAATHRERIKALSYILSRASHPVLCLPAFHGTYEDLGYELARGIHRIGYVFGPPGPDSQLNGNQCHDYEGNLYQYPPRTLSSLIRAQDPSGRPFLGERFRLATTLAIAFSRFHAAGWLHKGLHSASITFLQRPGGITSITEPFITGFQYSRPQQEASLTRGPLEEEALQPYYHPDADKGFTKRLDLYSLGVVLCEIGRWDLLENTTDKARTKHHLNSKTAWREYVMANWLKDLGWRMGKKYQDAVEVLLECKLPGDSEDDDLFAQQFQQKVIQPLSSCVA